MNIAGKVEPELERLADWYATGFDSVELFLTTEMLDSRGVTDILETCEQASIDIANVHTPHVAFDDANTSQYVDATDTLATELGATLVIDMNPTSTRYTPFLFPPDQLDAPRIGYENDPGVSPYYLRVNHLDQGYPLVLDTAHLHMSSESYDSFLTDIAGSSAEATLPVIHLADGTRVNDGLPFGEGTVDLEQIVKTLVDVDYPGTVVVETPVNAQHDALDDVRHWISATQ